MAKFMMRKGQFLSCSSPDGAMAFCWMERKKDNYIATGRTVTLAHIHAFLKHSDGKHFAEEGWKVFNNYGQLRLVAPVRRINPDTIELQNNGKKFPVQYTINPTYVHHNGHISFHAISATFEVKEVGRMELKNWSMLYQIVFFLNHETLLTPEQNTCDLG